MQLEEEIDDSNHKLILDVFGFEIHRMLCATAWDDRAQALASARAMCEANEIPSTVSRTTFLDACCKLVLISLQDKVMPVFFDGLDLLKFMLGDFFVRFPEADEVVRENLEHLLPVVIGKCGDRNARSLEGTRQALVFLARSKCVGCTPVMAHLFSPVQNHKERVLIRGRLDLINHVIDEFGFGKSSTITMQLVMGFVRPHLDATDEKIRRAAVEVTVNCYRHKGDRTLKYVTNVKPALLKLLQQRFSEVDRPAKGSRKHAHSAQGLPAVRGKPRKHQIPPRQAVSQPTANSAAKKPFNKQPATAEELLRDEPELLMGMGDRLNVLDQHPQLMSPGIGSPLSVAPIPPRSMRDEPPMMLSPHSGMLPGSLDGGLYDGAMGMGRNNFDDELDDELMNEIEAY